MSYGWTKKYKAITLEELLDLVDELYAEGLTQEIARKKCVLYFKVVIRKDKSFFETRSTLKSEDK